MVAAGVAATIGVAAGSIALFELELQAETPVLSAIEPITNVKN